jgi:flagellar M-ring protein FliF
MSPKGRLVLGASAVGIMVVAFMLFRIAAAPSYTTVMTGLDPADTGKITAKLDEKGIGYELQNNGTALGVEKAQTAQARIALAEGGLNTGASTEQPGYELLKDQKLGASDFQQRITYQRALEGEIAKTVDQVEGVNGATVQLSLPEDELFSDEKKPATAAVLLGGGAGDLDAASVKGIANLVSSGVENLKTENVTITDGTGRMVWPQNGGAAGDGMSTASKTAAEARYANELESSLNALLMRTVGSGKAQVKVKADLDVDQVKEKQLRYARRGTPLTETEDTETLEGQGGSTGGSGTRANIPTYQAAGGGSGQSNYEKRSVQRTLGVDKTVTDSVKAPGTINRLDVALVLDKSLAPQKAELEKAIAGAAGIQQDRGDTITTSQLAFVKQPAAAPAKGSVPPGALGIAKYVGLGLAALLFLFFVSRGLRKREDEALMGEPMWLRQIEAPTSLSELEAAQVASAGSVAPAPVDTRQKVEEAVRKEPERVAAQVRSWLSEDL